MTVAVPAPLPPDVTVIQVVDELPVTVGAGAPDAVTVELELPVLVQSRPFAEDIGWPTVLRNSRARRSQHIAGGPYHDRAIEVCTAVDKEPVVRADRLIKGGRHFPTS